MERVNHPKIISISSGKGGVGKTSTAVNLAAVLGYRSRSVLLIDGDLGLANVDVLLGLNGGTIKDALDNTLSPRELIMEILPGMMVLPASSGVPEMANLSPGEHGSLHNLLLNLVQSFDFILVDTAAGIGNSVLWFNNWATHNIIILTPDPTSLTDAYALIKVLYQKYGRDRFYLIVNSIKTEKEGQAVFENMCAVVEKFLHFKPQFLGTIPDDRAVALAVRKQKPFVQYAPTAEASMAIAAIAEKLEK